MDYVRYLRSKRTVDDRAINLRVLGNLKDILKNRALPAVIKNGFHLRVLEIGAGVGSMLIRLWTYGIFAEFESVEYTLFDIKPEVLEEARSLIVRELGHSAEICQACASIISSSSRAGDTEPGTIDDHHARNERFVDSENHILTLEFPAINKAASGRQRLRVNFRVGDALVALNTWCDDDRVDFVIAAAFLDLTDIQSSVPAILRSLHPGRGSSIFYFPINFDGITSLSPPTTAGIEFDRRVEYTFHLEMGVDAKGERRSETGRRLLPLLKAQGACNLSAGSSAWIVSAGSNGEYQADEEYFLKCIVEFVSKTLSRRLTVSEEFHQDALTGYAHCRSKQIENNTLTYVAHNMDFCGYME